MRRFYSVACLTAAAALLTPFAARAETIDDISIAGPGLSISYISPNPIEVAHTTDRDVVFGAQDFGAIINGDPNYFLSPIYGLAGGSESNVSVIILANSTDGPASYDLTFYGPQLVQLLSQGPLYDTFELTPGTYGVTDSSAPNAYTLKVTPEGTTVTPEPASLTLLSTGAIGVVSALRRRRCLSGSLRNA